MTSADGPVDAAQERRRTPGSQVYRPFNSAGCSLPTADTLATVIDHLRLEAAEGGYEAAASVVDRTRGVYAAVARLLGSTAEEIALFDSASSALRTLVDAWTGPAGSHVIVSRSSYVSHALHLLRLAEQRGIELHIIENTGEGRIDLVELDRVLAAIGSEHSVLVSVAHVPTSSGLVEPVDAIGRIIRKYGALFLVDATQSVGQIPIDVGAIGCDVLVGTGRKFLRAPRGTGFAYVRSGSDASFTTRAPDVRGTVWDGPRSWRTVAGAVRFETWEHSVACRLGLGSAVEQALELGIGRVGTTISAQAATLRAGLAAITGVTVRDPSAAGSGIVTFTVDGVPSTEVVAHLRASDVRVTSVPASHGQWDLGDRGIDSVVRASVHVYNTQADLDALLAGVADVVSPLGSAVIA